MPWLLPASPGQEPRPKFAPLGKEPTCGGASDNIPLFAPPVSKLMAFMKTDTSVPSDPVFAALLGNRKEHHRLSVA